jgi:hypothetical protein
MTMVELPITFPRAVRLAEETLGARAYYLHNQVGSAEWSVKNIQGRTFLRVQDPRMATFFLLKL